jgi:kinetochore protein Nuf2
MLIWPKQQCSITDFAFSDIYRPTYPRLQKILSYIINFVRFRESQTAHIDKYFDEAERTKLKVQQLYSDKENLEARLAQLQRESAVVDRVNREKEEALAELKPKLLDLDRKKGRLVQENARAEEEKKQLIRMIEERAAMLDTTRDEVAKLRPYTLQKPETLESSVRELNGGLAAEKSQMELLERRTRALQTSADSFAAATADVQACTRLLTDLAADMAKEEEEQSKASRHKEALSDRRNIVQDVERQEKLLQQQLDTIAARTEKLRNTAAEKGNAASVKMGELKVLHASLQTERNEKAREIERRRVRIEQTEKKVRRVPYTALGIACHFDHFLTVTNGA